MERIVITIRPTPSDAERLDVEDAMQQVIDAVKLMGEAEKAITSPQESFKWKLESASTKSPFTVVAVAEPVHPGIDISNQVRRVKAEFASGMRKLVNERAPAWWMDQRALSIAYSVFARTTNGISNTEIEISADEKIVVDRSQAVAGVAAVAAITAISVVGEIAARTAYGEIRGVMVAAGRYRNRPAIQARTDQYGFVWCQLANEGLIAEFGDRHVVREIWEGKTIGVEGRLIYADGGKLSRVEATSIREITTVPRVNLDDVLDKEFTAGLDPVEYLRRLHEGELA